MHALRLFRRVFGIGMLDLAIESGVSCAEIRKIEKRAKHPTQETLRRLDDALDKIVRDRVTKEAVNT